MARQAVTPHGLRTRAALLDAARSLAGERGLAGLSVSAVTARAGVAKGTFYVHFADRAALVEALRSDFRARTGEAIQRATARLDPGARRLVAGLVGYLDASLHDSAIKALLREARREPGAADSGETERAFAAAIAPNLRAMGWREPAVGARLVVALVGEVSVIELEAGAKVPAARRALRRLIERSDLSRAG